MRRVPSSLGLLLGISLVMAGCSVRQGDMTIISSRNITLDRVDLDSLPQVRQITGRSTKYNILGIPLGFPHLEDAIDEALDKGNGDLMTDAVIHLEGWTAILFGASTIKVKGTVIDSRGAPR